MTIALVFAWLGCRRETVAPPIEVINEGTTFDIFWPPRESERSSGAESSPLLNGELLITPSPNRPGSSFQLRITLRRPHAEHDRTRWNGTLAFPEYDWMSRVRVWDHDDRWLWPNLPYLLRAHGEERVERYGGVDPGKGVDNDFAAVLIRPIDDDISTTMVSAEWVADDGSQHDKHSVVHVATSDRFTLQLSPDAGERRSGRLGVWLIYADFLGASPPRSWPRADEYNGGILAYLEVIWRINSEDDFEFTTQHLVPPTATGFDWAQWATGPSALEKKLELVCPPETLR